MSPEGSDKMQICQDIATNVYLTPEEHHSNYLPWIELAKRNTNIHINIIKMTENFDLDFIDLENKIKNTTKDTVNIISLTACSNVLGIKIDVEMRRINKQI